MQDHFVQQFTQSQAKQDSLAEQRQLALAQFQAAGFPTAKQEAWKYTRVDPILKQQFSLAKPASNINLEDIEAYCLLESYRLVFVDGYYIEALSELPTAFETIKPLSQRLAQDREWLAKQWQQSADHAFVALNHAFADEGAVLRVPAGVIVDKPVQLLFIASGEGDTWITHPRIFVELAAGAQLELLESYIGLADNCYFNNVTSHFELAANSQLDYTRLQQESQNAFHLAHTVCQQAEDSEFRVNSLSCGGRLARHEITDHLQGNNAHSKIAGVFWAQGKQHIEDRVHLMHEQAHANSDVDYRGILDEAGRGVFNGKITVAEQAQKTQADLNNKNLLLSDRAEIDTKPELEIYADDVKCSHGATVGQLNEDAWFSLRSRGIPAQAARNMLIQAFAHASPVTFSNPAIAVLWQDILQQAGQALNLEDTSCDG